MVDRIVDITRSEEVELVIIAGDLFDRAIPPAEAIDLFDHALAELRATGATVVAISGNHDSPIRVSTHDRILAEAGVIIRGSISRSHEPALLPGGDGGPPIAIYAIPYLEPSVAAPILGEVDLEVIDLDSDVIEPEDLLHPDDVAAMTGSDPQASNNDGETFSNPTLFDALLEAATDRVEASEASSPERPEPTRKTSDPVTDQPSQPRRRRAGHHDVTAAVTRRIRDDLASRGRLRSIVVSHTFLTGGKSRDSERELSMGSLSTVGVNAFDDFDYVALGHLHGRQQFEGGRVAYCGSPLPYSFSEERDIKSVSVVDLGPRGELTVERIELNVGRPLRTIEGELEDLLISSRWVDTEPARVRAKLTDRRLPAQAMARLRQRFPHAVELRHTPPVEVRTDAPTPISQRRADDPVAVAQRFLAEIHNMSLDEADQQLLEDAFVAALDRDETETELHGTPAVVTADRATGGAAGASGDSHEVVAQR